MQTVKTDLLDLKPGDQVLDLGCGRGRHAHAAYAAASVHVVALDLSRDDLKAAQEGLSFFGALPDDGRRFSPVCASALMLPFADGAFDHIICSEVLEHIEDYGSALAEIERVLKPGGRLAISVPRFMPEYVCWKLSQEYHETPGGHLRIFRQGPLTSEIEARSMRFVTRHFAHGLHSPYWWLKCAVGVSREDVKIVNLYRRFLEWDILSRPFLTRVLEKLASPLMGKSLVLYFVKKARM